jgi:hypothetical protein
VVAKTRFHRGITANFRTHLRQAGIAVDEELAHKLLAGRPAGIGKIDEIVTRLRDSSLNDSNATTRFDLMRMWENDHPGARPFPAPFAQRVLDKVRAVEEIINLEGDPSLLLGQLEALCRAELSDDEDLPDFDH